MPSISAGNAAADRPLHVTARGKENGNRRDKAADSLIGEVEGGVEAWSSVGQFPLAAPAAQVPEHDD